MMFHSQMRKKMWKRGLRNRQNFHFSATLKNGKHYFSVIVKLTTASVNVIMTVCYLWFSVRLRRVLSKDKSFNFNELLKNEEVVSAFY